MVSNMVSNKDRPPASATPPPRVTEHKPDPRLGCDNRQRLGSGCVIGS
jgi:hypothetical protein